MACGGRGCTRTGRIYVYIHQAGRARHLGSCTAHMAASRPLLYTPHPLHSHPVKHPSCYPLQALAKIEKEAVEASRVAAASISQLTVRAVRATMVSPLMVPIGHRRGRVRPQAQAWASALTVHGMGEGVHEESVLEGCSRRGRRVWCKRGL